MTAKKKALTLRSDARDNREKLLAAARRLFDRSGYGVGVDDIAREAGLGVGTFYRHFPTKESLFHATVVSHFEDLISAAREATEADDVAAAFHRFLERFLELGRKKKNLFEALAKEGFDVSVAHEQVAGAFHAAAEAMLARARGAGVVREGIRLEELIALLRGTFAALGPAADDAARARLLAVVIDGLRPPVPPAGRG